ANVMDVDVVKAPVNAAGKLDGAGVSQAISEAQADGKRKVFAVVGTAGSTNLGVVDDLKSISASAKSAGVWFHVDGAYGLAGLCAPSVRSLFDGVEQADSFIVDPHKWLFAPYDAVILN
ncbi:MAG: hypothetical protein RL313_764, partial [Actinomycetota bacterium]